jgi:hypothetical protein
LAIAAERPQIRPQIPRLGLVFDAGKQLLCVPEFQFRILDVVEKSRLVPGEETISVRFGIAVPANASTLRPSIPFSGGPILFWAPTPTE